MISCIALCASLASPALAAPEYGTQAVVATVDYDAVYWGQGLSYVRVIELQHSGENNGTLVASYELYTSGLSDKRPGYNIHVSRDGGSTWTQTATVREKAAAIQSEYQPFLYELPCALGDMPEGTLLLAACSIDSSHAKQSALRMYRSFDIGVTWEQFGTIATGGGLTTGVWEPFLLMLPEEGQLACYYSDSTDEPHHSQKLVMRLSPDGKEWGDTIDVVAMESQELRPGMSTVAKMNDGRYIMTYEMCNANDPNCGNPVYYRYSRDGVDWGNPKDAGVKVVTDRGAVPGSCPYIAYCAGYGENGLLLMTSGFQTPGQSKGNIVYVNDQLGDPGAWKTWFLPKNYRNPKGGYSRAIFPASDGLTMYFVDNIPDPNSEMNYHMMVFTRYRFDENSL